MHQVSKVFACALLTCRVVRCLHLLRSARRLDTSLPLSFRSSHSSFCQRLPRQSMEWPAPCSTLSSRLLSLLPLLSPTGRSLYPSGWSLRLRFRSRSQAPVVTSARSPRAVLQLFEPSTILVRWASGFYKFLCVAPRCRLDSISLRLVLSCACLRIWSTMPTPIRWTDHIVGRRRVYCLDAPPTGYKVRVS